MDVSQLKTLIHVAELGSLSKAADRLNIVQPALSRQVRMLEQELGVVLFERHGRGMALTDIGREIAEHASVIMAELDAIRDVAAGKDVSFGGSVMVGATPTVAEIITLPLVSQIREQHPGLSLRLLSAFSGHLLDWLHRGEIDVALSYDPEALRSVRIEPVMMESLLLVAPAAAGLRLDQPVRFASLADCPLVLPSPRHGLRQILDACAKRVGITLHAQLEADAFRAMVELVRAGYGMTVLPLAPIFAMVQAGELSVATLIDPVPSRKLVIAYPADRPVSPASKYVGRTIIDIAADLVAKEVWMGSMLTA